MTPQSGHSRSPFCPSVQSGPLSLWCTPRLGARRHEGRIYHTPSSSQSSLSSADAEFSLVSPTLPSLSPPTIQFLVQLRVKPAPKRLVLKLAPAPPHASPELSIATHPGSLLSPEFTNALSCRRKMVKLTRTLSENITQKLVFPPSFCHAQHVPRPIDRPAKNTAVDVPQSTPPFSADVAFASAEEKLQTWRRKEHEWSGEWNVRDYERVVRRPRGLKARR